MHVCFPRRGMQVWMGETTLQRRWNHIGLGGVVEVCQNTSFQTNDVNIIYI